jgi:hypothetical protein
MHNIMILIGFIAGNAIVLLARYGIGARGEGMNFGDRPGHSHCGARRAFLYRAGAGAALKAVLPPIGVVQSAQNSVWRHDPHRDPTAARRGCPREACS